MTGSRLLGLALLLPLLGGCNMLISEEPMFGGSDRAALVPRDGIWLSPDKGCDFDSSRPESGWPECAMWVVVRNGGTDLYLTDGKRQSQVVGGFFAAGDPQILQAYWIDTDKQPHRAFYGFFGVEIHQVGPDGRYSAASVWPVECGTQSNPNADIQPYPGVGADCRPSSKEAIRPAAEKSRRTEQIEEWRWLRAEATAKGN